jgi:hypothetical protein
VAGKLHPRVPLFFVRLEEGRPLDDVAQLPPTGRLQQTTNQTRSIFC